MSERPPISPRSPRAALEPEQVPPPPKRSDRARNPFVIVGNAIFTILIILMIGAGATYYYGKQTLEAPGPLQEDKIVNIPARAGKRDIADVLSREGVINVNPWIFIGSVFALKASSDLKPGEYSFQKNASLRDVIATIVDGKVVQHAITIPEGLTSEQIVSRLSDNDIFTGSVREIPREGTLLPETYKFPRGTTRDQVIQRLQQAQRGVAQACIHRAGIERCRLGSLGLVQLHRQLGHQQRIDPQRYAQHGFFGAGLGFDGKRQRQRQHQIMLRIVDVERTVVQPAFAPLNHDDDARLIQRRRHGKRPVGTHEGDPVQLRRGIALLRCEPQHQLDHTLLHALGCRCHDSGIGSG